MGRYLTGRLIYLLLITGCLLAWGAGRQLASVSGAAAAAARLEVTGLLGAMALGAGGLLRFLPLPWSDLLADSSGRRRAAWLVVAALVAAYILLVGSLAWRRHVTYHSGTYDLGIQDQLVWNTAHGRPYATSVEVSNYLGDHFKPLVAMLAPLYWIAPSVAWLIWFQTVALALGTVPLVRLALRHLRSPAASVLVGLVYLLYPSVAAVNLFDFHWEATAIPLFLAAFDAADRGAWRWASLWLALALLGKEEMGVTVAAFGVWLAWRGRRRLGLVWAGVGVTTSLLALFVLIPAFRQGPSDTQAGYGWLGDSVSSLVGRILQRPGLVLAHLGQWSTVDYLLALLAPLLFLPLFSPATGIALPALLTNLLSNWPFQQSVYFQYVTPIAPFVLAGGVLGAARVQRRLRADWQRATLWLGLLFFALLNALPLLAVATPPPLANAAAVDAGLAQVPPDAAVLTTNYYGAHLAHRRRLQVPHDVDALLAFGPVDLIFLNLRDPRHVTESIRCQQYVAVLQRARAQGFGLTFLRDGVVILTLNQGDGGAIEALAGSLCPS